MQGHIRKRGKDSWTVVVEQGRDPVTGKRKQLWRSVKGTKREAGALLVQLLHQRDTGIDVPPGKITLAEFLERWLEDYARPNVSPKTFLQYSDFVHRQLIPAIGAVPLAKLRPQHIQRYYSHALQRGRADGKGGLSPKTVLHIHRLLRQALGHAVKWQILARNPADAVAPPRPQRFEPPVLAPAETRRLLTTADQTPHGALIHTAVMTGLRRGELLGLRWQDLDLDAGVLRVRQAAQWLPGQGWSFRPPKTHRSRRPVALAPATLNVLKQHRRRQLQEKVALGPAYRDHDLVFASPLGTPIDPSNLRRAWARIVEATGLPHLRFHDLRHIHATLLLLGGIHPKVVAERLGHTDVAITLNTYSHVLPHLQSQAAAGLERMLAAGGDA
jgi:integrase